MVDAVVEQAPEEAIKPLTPEYAARILFRSYEHSQGNAALQGLLFEYLHLIRPKWQINDREEEIVKSLVKPRIMSYLSPEHAVHKDLLKPRSQENSDVGELEEKVMNSLSQELGSMRRILSSEEDLFIPDRPILIRKIAQGVIEGDLRFLKIGRQRFGLDPKTPKVDPYFSFLVHYALQGNPTGIKEFDQMYKDIRQTTLLPEAHQGVPAHTLKNLNNLIALYNAKHPDSPVELPK